MSYHKHTKITLFVLAFFLAGCAQTATPAPAEYAPPYATVAPGALAPGVAVGFAQSTADALAWQATQIAVSRQSTVAAADRAVAEAQHAEALATTEIERFNTWATQQAGSMRQTATAGAFALQQREAEVYQTQVALTQVAANADLASVEARENARKEEWAERNRQTDFVLKLGLAVLAIVALAILILYGARWLSIIIAISARRRLIVEQAGVFYDMQSGELRPLPNNAPLPLPPPQPKTQTSRLKQIVMAHHDPQQQRRARERRERQAWRTAAWYFLQWGETEAGDGEAVGYSVRRMKEHARVGRDACNTMTGFLAVMGALERAGVGPTATWRRRLNEQGAEMTTEAVMGELTWQTSFTYPSPTPPEIPAPPVKSAVTPPAQTHTRYTVQRSTVQRTPPAQPVTSWNLSTTESTLRAELRKAEERLSTDDEP